MLFRAGFLKGTMNFRSWVTTTLSLSYPVLKYLVAVVLDALGHFERIACFDLADHFQQSRRFDCVYVVAAQMRENVSLQASEDHFCVARRPSGFGCRVPASRDRLEAVLDDHFLLHVANGRVSNCRKALARRVPAIPRLCKFHVIPFAEGEAS